MPGQSGNGFDRDSKRRKKTRNEMDPESSSSNRDRIKEPWKHMRDRFLRLWRLAGVIKRIAKKYGIPIKKVVTLGRSRCQDRNCSIPGHHASHVLRCGEIHPDVQGADREELEFLLGHTQNTLIAYNLGLGRAIDDFQEQNLHLMLDICSRDIIYRNDLLDLRIRYTRMLQENVTNRSVQQQVTTVIINLNHIGCESIIQAYRDGLTGDYLDAGSDLISEDEESSETSESCSSEASCWDNKDNDDRDQNGAANQSHNTSNSSSNDNNRHQDSGAKSNNQQKDSNSSSSNGHTESSNFGKNLALGIVIAVPVVAVGAAVAAVELASTIALTEIAAGFTAGAATKVAAGATAKAVTTGVIQKAALGLFGAFTFFNMNRRRRDY